MVFLTGWVSRRTARHVRRIADRRAARTIVRLALSAGAMLCLATAGAACGGGHSAADSTNGTQARDGGGAGGTPKQGGTATVALAGVSSGLDPAANRPYSVTDAPDMNAIFGTLVYEEPATGDVKMGFLKSLTGSKDLKTWTLVLPGGLKFSDGTPFNAAAIKYNWERIQQPATASRYQSVIEGWKFEVTDSTTLTVKLPTPNSAFPAEVAESLASIGSPAAMRAEGKKFAVHPVGAGPFKVQSFTPGSKVTVVRNPYYKRFAPGQPHLDQIVFQALPDTSQQANALRTRQAQMGWTLGSGDKARMLESGNVKAVTTTLQGCESLVLSQKHLPFSDPVAREAFSLAMDREAIANAMLPGTKAVRAIVSPESPYYDPKYDFPKQDPKKAQALFDQLAAEGHPFDVTYMAVPTDRSAVLANTIQSTLAKYKNVTAHIETVPLATFSSRLSSGDFDVTIHGIASSALQPNIYNHFAPDGSLNTYGVDDPEMTQALSQILRIPATDTAALKPLYDTFQARLLAENPVYCGAQVLMAFEYTDDLTNVNVVNQGGTIDWGEVGYQSEQS